MTSFNTPGVYIQEISTLPASVVQVETAIPAFIGLTENTVADPKRITSMVDFSDIFGGPDDGIITIEITAGNEVNPAVAAPASNKLLYYHMQMYFANGGGPCYVISAGNFSGSLTTLKVTGALTKLKMEDEPTLIVIPEAINIAGSGFYDSMKAALGQCNDLQDRFTIMDLIDGGSAFTTDISNFRTGIGTQYLKYGAAYYPHLQTTLQYANQSVNITNNGSLTNVSSGTLKEIVDIAADPSHASFDMEYPDFLNKHLGGIQNLIAEQTIVLGASSSMAGVFARVDSDRGVWKAPANVSLNYVSEPVYKINNADQESWNVDSTGKTVNAIRLFKGKGNIVWGARTLAGNDNEWRYVPVRRLFITMEESIKKATEFVVFEPNDKNTWERVRTMIESYLSGLWRQGALAGAKPADAFFVNVGLGQTMTAQDILEGKLIVEVGVAAVRPAEFIILNFSHKLQES
jgi:phage tail sheath protein FI